MRKVNKLGSHAARSSARQARKNEGANPFSGGTAKRRSGPVAPVWISSTPVWLREGQRGHRGTGKPGGPGARPPGPGLSSVLATVQARSPRATQGGIQPQITGTLRCRNVLLGAHLVTGPAEAERSVHALTNSSFLPPAPATKANFTLIPRSCPSPLFYRFLSQIRNRGSHKVTVPHGLPMPQANKCAFTASRRK